MRRATLADGTRAVVKLIVPRAGDAAANEIRALRLAEGEVRRLLRADEPRAALLLERLGRPLHELGLSLRHRHEILCAAASRVWRPAPGSGLTTGAEKGRWLAAFIQEKWRRLTARARKERSTTPSRCVRRAGSTRTTTNVPCSSTATCTSGTRSRATTVIAVDPDGLLAEPEYDLGILMREDPLTRSRTTRGRGRAGSPDDPGSTPRRSGSGAWWSAGRPGSSARRSSCSRWDGRCSSSPMRSRRSRCWGRPSSSRAASTRSRPT